MRAKYGVICVYIMYSIMMDCGVSAKGSHRKILRLKLLGRSGNI